MTGLERVDPELRAPVEAFPPMSFSRETLGQVRATVDSFTADYRAPEGDPVRLTRVAAPGAGGAPEVEVLVYAPETRSRPAPAIFYIHGGGYVSGRPHHSEAWCRQLVRDLGCVVAAVDYRKAPETRFPGAVEDCYAALTWLHQEAQALGIDPARIAVEGVSAGGGLAASLALMVRDRGELSLAFQLLVYPMLDDRTGRREGPPRRPGLGEFVWTYDTNAFGWEQLLGDAVGGANVSPYAAAARAGDLSGLPPTFIGVGALDALAPENIQYALRLIEAGVEAELHVYPGAYHGFDAFDAGQSAVGNAFRNARLDALRRALMS